MKVLLINAPSRRNALVPPMGLLQVGAILEGLGHTPLIFDPILDNTDQKHLSFSSLDQILYSFKPAIVGYSGVATSYGKAKHYALYIRRRYPQIIQIAGGPLASVSSLLLTKASLDVVVHGEAEVSLPLLMEQFDNGKAIHDMPGISFLHTNGETIRNKPATQIENLDELPLPAYHLVDFPRYFRHVQDNIELFKDTLGSGKHLQDILDKVGTDDRFVEVMTGRGCTHHCLFCYRHMKGIRYFSVDYVVRHVKFLQENYGMRGFQFADELFNGDTERVFALCDAIEASGLNIFYTVGGARVDKIDEKMLRRLKETGCIEINYGHESGSEKILKEYRKGTTSEQNKDITLLTTKRVGLICPVQLVIGSPGETDNTIHETIQFLKDVDAYRYSLNYLIPLPETPIWEYVTKNRLVNDVERYLDLVAEYGGAPLLNLTQASDRIWKNWQSIIRKELELHYHKKRGPKLLYIYKLIFFKLIAFLPEWLKSFIKRIIRLCKGEKGKSVV
jgi:anaerobic magnesium-protoporphyrin IX monomethyl ester cyclase